MAVKARWCWTVESENLQVIELFSNPKSDRTKLFLSQILH
jgi:hypothetical protein